MVAKLQRRKKQQNVYKPKPFVEWHPLQTRPHDWAVFVTLDQENPEHVEKFGCRICKMITFNSAFIGTSYDENWGRQLCLYHSVSIVRLKKDWLPSGVAIKIKKMPSYWDRREEFEQWKALAIKNETFGINFYK